MDFLPKQVKTQNGAGGFSFWKFLKKNFFGEVLDPFELPTGRNLKYLQKNGVLEFLEQVICPGSSSPCLKLDRKFPH